MSTSEQGKCPVCGYVNKEKWIYCNSCGQRLPWAPPPRKVKLSELSDEELGLFFYEPKEKKINFFLTPEGRFVLQIVVFIVIFTWVFILGK